MALFPEAFAAVRTPAPAERAEGDTPGAPFPGVKDVGPWRIGLLDTTSRRGLLHSAEGRFDEAEVGARRPRLPCVHGGAPRRAGG